MVKKILTTFIFLLVICVSIIGVWSLKVNKDKPQGNGSQTLSVKYLENSVQENGAVSLHRSAEHKFYVNKVGYVVNVSFNHNLDATFTKDGAEVKYSTLGDVTKHFNVKHFSNYFIITLNSFNMEEFMQTLFPSSTLDLGEYSDSVYYFTATVTAGESTLSFNFSITDALTIKLNYSEIIF